MKIGIAVSIAVVLFGSSVSAAEPGRYALLVGCTEYPHLRRQHPKHVYEQSIELYGPGNDVELFKDLLVGRLGFAPSSITVLSGWDRENPASRPTKQNIKNAFSSIAGRAEDGDFVVILLAGHGSQQPACRTRSGDGRSLEPDGLDEIFLPADVQNWQVQSKTVVNAIADDEIGRWLQLIYAKGAFVWIIFDACHSGTMIRGQERSRFLSPALLGVPEAAQNARVRARGGVTPVAAFDKRSPGPLDAAPGSDGIVAFYAAQPYETTPERPMPRGIETRKENYHGLFSFMLADVLEHSPADRSFRDLMNNILSRYRAFPRSAPVPFCEGDIDQPVFGLKNAAAAGEKSLFARLYCGRADMRIRLSVQGFPDTEALEEKIAAEYGILVQPVDDVMEADWMLRFSGGTAHLIPAAGPDLQSGEGLVFGPYDTAAREAFLRDAARDLRLIYRWQNLCRIAAAHAERRPREDVRLDIELLKCRNEHDRQGVAVPGSEGALQIGDWLGIRIRNRGSEAIDLTMLYLDSDFGIQALVPGRVRSANRIKAGSTLFLGPFPAGQETPVPEHFISIALPVKDPKKKTCDFSFLAQGGMKTRGDGADNNLDAARLPLRTLLQAAAFDPATRGGKTAERTCGEMKPALYVNSFSVKSARP